ncbi:N-acetyl-gamma-glutamyl-phosphate reductase [Tissierella creatinini]|nr:N-acetyl-gamma-glutamyl-phosphate reductase [Tissierella creatinini]TJX63780.1 N-acetyl-gamma-glutamyl-phosphate reductase [Soehngenia saccharolytica]
MIKAGVVGATGYGGQQLVWLLRSRADVEISFISSHSNVGTEFDEIYGNYKGFLNLRSIDMNEISNHINNIDVLFLALPHGKAFELVELAYRNGVKVIDISADYRLKDEDEYEQWYGLKHGAPELLKEAVYGLPELFRDSIKNANIIANPGCYPTSSILALAPLLKNGLIDTKSIIIDAKSGVSGAGRSANISNLYAEVNESFKAYGLTNHRHTPEIEQVMSDLSREKITLNFSPHLVPMNRGILATCYANLKDQVSQDELYDLYNKQYEGEYFVRVLKTLPETRWVRNSNICDIGLRVDKRTNRVIVVSAIDNLVKGAAGQAVQNMNLMFGIEETKGIDMIPMAP